MYEQVSLKRPMWKSLIVMKYRVEKRKVRVGKGGRGWDALYIVLSFRGVRMISDIVVVLFMTITNKVYRHLSSQ